MVAARAQHADDVAATAAADVCRCLKRFCHAAAEVEEGSSLLQQLVSQHLHLLFTVAQGGGGTQVQFRGLAGSVAMVTWLLKGSTWC